MDMAQRLRERLKREFGIETDADLQKAVAEIDLELGIFVTPFEEGKRNAS